MTAEWPTHIATNMNNMQVATVVLAWSVSPLFRRAAIDKMGEGSEHAYVVYQSIVCAALAASLACSRQKELVEFAQTGGLLAFFFVAIGSCIALGSSYMLSLLLAKNNPGIVIAMCNGAVNIVGYVMSTLFYGTLSLRGTIGVALTSAGIYLLKSH